MRTVNIISTSVPIKILSHFMFVGVSKSRLHTDDTDGESKVWGVENGNRWTGDIFGDRRT